MTIAFKDIEGFVDSIETGVNSVGEIELSIHFRENLSDEDQLKIKEFIVEVYQKDYRGTVKEILERVDEVNGMSAYRKRTMGIK